MFLFLFSFCLFNFLNRSLIFLFRFHFCFLSANWSLEKLPTLFTVHTDTKFNVSLFFFFFLFRNVSFLFYSNRDAIMFFLKTNLLRESTNYNGTFVNPVGAMNAFGKKETFHAFCSARLCIASLILRF